MGADHSQIASDTGLVESEIRRLRDKFDILRKTRTTNDDNITEEAFVTHFSNAHEQLARRIFRAMDVRRHGSVDFRDFCVAVAILSKGTQEAKLEFAFSLYDKEGHGYVSRRELEEAVAVFRHSSDRLLSELGVNDPAMTSEQDAARILLTSMQQSAAATTTGGSGGATTHTSTTTGASSGTATAPSHHSAVAAGSEDRVSKEEFFLFFQHHPEIFRQVQTSWHALQQAALWDWEQSQRPAGTVRPSMTPSDCCVQ